MALYQQEKQIQEMAELLKTLAHPTRLQIVRCLGRYGRLNAMTLQKQVPVTQGVMSAHLIKMADRRVLKRSRIGRETYYSLADPWVMNMLNAMMPA